MLLLVPALAGGGTVPAADAPGASVLRRGPVALALAEDGRWLYVANRCGTVAVIVVRPEVDAPIYIPITIGALVILTVLGAILDRAKVYPHQQPQPAAPPAPDAAREAVAP